VLPHFNKEITREDKKFYDIQVSGQEEPLTTYDTYEEAICALYRMHCLDPKMDVYIKEYEITYTSSFCYYSEERHYQSQVSFVKSYELDVLGAFNYKEIFKETA